MVTGDLETGKSVLRPFINGTIGFIKLGADLGRSPKTLIRMFSPSGNPQARNLFEIVAHLQKIDGTVLEVVDRTAAQPCPRPGHDRDRFLTRDLTAENVAINADYSTQNSSCR